MPLTNVMRLWVKEADGLTETRLIKRKKKKKGWKCQDVALAVTSVGSGFSPSARIRENPLDHWQNGPMPRLGGWRWVA